MKAAQTKENIMKKRPTTYLKMKVLGAVEFAEGAVFVTPRDQQVVGRLVVLDVLGVELEERCQVLHDVTDPL